MMKEVILRGVVIHVLNVWQTCAWYKEVFGLGCAFDPPNGSAAAVAVAVSGAEIMFTASEAERENIGNFRENSFLCDAAGVHFLFEVPDVCLYYDQAIAHGGVGVLEPTMKPSGRLEASLRDLNGIYIKLVETVRSIPITTDEHQAG